MMRLLLLTTLSVALAPSLAAQQTWNLVQSRQGSADDIQFGSAVAGIGDVTGDGLADYVVGAWTDDSGVANGGSFSLFSGAVSGNTPLAKQSGSGLASKLGWRVVALGTHNGDNRRKFAVSAPLHSGGAGPLCGQVQIAYWDSVQAQLVAFDTLEGVGPGDLFGGGLAAFDYDGDGDLDLAVGAIGSGTMDGRVDVFALDNVSAGVGPAVSLQGAAGMRDLFGFSMDTAGGLAGQPEGLMVGVPLFDGLAANEGAVEIVDFPGGTPASSALTNPLAGTANARFGWSVSGAQDLDGDGFKDLIVGAPNTANGDVCVFNGASLVLFDQLTGETAGDRFGFAVAGIGDGNMDGFGDYVIGAPGFQGNFGKIYVRTLRPGSLELFQRVAPTSAKAGFGYALGNAGDINNDGVEEMLVGAPLTADRDGFSAAYRPPLTPPDAIDLEFTGELSWENDVTIDLINLDTSSVPGTLYWYVGDMAGTSVSPQGYDLDIAGNVELIASGPNPGTGVAEQIFRVAETRPAGSIVGFQVVEDRGMGFVRRSDVEGGLVVDPGPTLFVNGERGDLQQVWNLPITQTFDLEVRYALPNSLVYFYWGRNNVTPNPTTQAPDSPSQDPWFLTLNNPQTYGFVISDASGVATLGGLMPDAGWITTPTAFEAFDWDIFPENRGLTNVAGILFQ